MAEILNKDPFTYQQEQKEFLEELARFHVNRGTPYTRVPRIGGKDVDLYLLYRRVISFGGWRKVNESEDQWDQIIPDFHLPKGCSNATQAIKHIYIRYLDKYEKVHFHGEDPNGKDHDEDAETPARKKICLPLYGIPLSYNYSQHRITDSLRQNLGFSLDHVSLSDYEKLEKSLLSGLPNEVDFVINVCTLLSNEGKHVLKLNKSKHLLSLLMAHIGVFEEGAASLEDVYEFGWRKSHQRDFIHFWYDTMKKDQFDKLIVSCRKYGRKVMAGEEVLNLGRDMGKHDLEGQRVMQLAIILRNLSFEEDNAMYMSKNSLVFKFLLLCISSSYGSLRPLALDTMGNLAEKIVLSPKNCNSDMVIDLVCRCMFADDKLDVVRGLEILSKLCQNDDNDVMLEERLDDRIYDDIVRLLGVYDIQIIVHSLEALYQLSELGEHTATKIAAVKCAVGVLVNLLTIEAQSYGPNSLVGIKVVEYCPPPQPNAQQEEQATPSSQTVPASSQKSAPQTTPSKQPGNSVPVNCDVEATTCNWLQSTFESRENSSSISQLHLYAEYINFSKKFNLPQLLPVQSFVNCVKVVFTKVEVVNMVKEDGTPEITFRGIGKKLNPQPFALQNSVIKHRSSVVHSSAFPTTASSNPYATVDLTQTPTLRQRLMEPPRLSALQASPSLLPIGGTTGTTSAISSSLSSMRAQSAPILSPANPTPQKTASRPHQPIQPKPNVIQQSVPVQPPTINVAGHLSSGASSPSLLSPGGSQLQQSYRPVSVLQQQLASPPQQSPTLPQQTGPPAPQNQNLPVFIIQPMYQNDQQQIASAPQGNLQMVLPDSANQKQSHETRLIKTLLAKKLRNQSGPVPICPKGSIDTGNPMQLLTFTTQQTNVIQGQLQQSYSIGTTAVVAAPQTQQYEQFTPIQGQVQVQVPTIDSSQLYHTQAVPNSVTNLPIQTNSSQTTPKQKGHQSRPQKSEKSKKKNNSGNSPSRKSSSSSGAHSSRSSSPKNLSSPKRTSSISSSSSSSNIAPPSPKVSSPAAPSPKSVDLEVCGEVERAKDVVQVGQEATIERVENKCLDQMNTIKKVTSEPANTLPSNSTDCVTSTIQTICASNGTQLSCNYESQKPSVNFSSTQNDTGQDQPNTTQTSFIVHSASVSLDQITSTASSLVSSCTSTAAPVLTSDSLITSTNGPINLQQDQYQLQDSLVPYMDSNLSDNSIYQSDERLRMDDSPENGGKECVNNANNNHQSIKSPEASEESSREANCVSAIAGFRERIESEKEENSLDNMESILSSEALRLEGYSNTREEAIFHSVSDSQLVRKIQSGKETNIENGNESLMDDAVTEDVKSTEQLDSTVNNDKPLQTAAVLNGGPEYQDEIIPSPSSPHTGMNGIDSMSEDSCPGKESLDIQKAVEKECINKLSEKLSKVNGIVHHVIGNGDRFEDSNDMEYEENLPVSEENSKDVVVAAEDIKHVVIHAGENDQVLIDSQGRLEINGTVTDMEFDTSEVDNVIDNPEQVLAVKSILQEPSEDENEESYISTEAECYELAGEPDEMDSQTMELGEDIVQDMGSEEVLIENEMCLKPVSCAAPSMGESTVDSELQTQEDAPTDPDDASLHLVLDEEEEKCDSVEFTENNCNLESDVDPETNCVQTAIDPIAEIAMKLGIDTEATDSVEDKDEIKEDPLLGQPLIAEPLVGQPLVGEPPLACIQFKGIPIVNSSLASFQVDLGAQSVLKDEQLIGDKNNSLVSTIFSVVTTTVSNDRTLGSDLGVIQSIDRPKGSQAMEVCTASRHVPTPEASRDSEFSCDSIASSLTDSSSTDKHSISINTVIQGIQSAVAKTTAASTSTPTPSSAKKSRTKSGEKKAKKRSRNTSGSADSRCSSASSTATAPGPEYMCEWASCKRCFENSRSVFCHVCSMHLTRDAEGICLWDGCEKLTRRRWSLFTHVQDHHCSEHALKAASVRRQQAQQTTGTSAKPHTVPALVYPPDAAWQAIRRFTPKPPYPEFVEPREGPVTKHIRLTAALVLRNLARYSSLGRSLIKQHERHISYTAMSALESSNALANCLWEVLHDH